MNHARRCIVCSKKLNLRTNSWSNVMFCCAKCDYEWRNKIHFNPVTWEMKSTGVVNYTFRGEFKSLGRYG